MALKPDIYPKPTSFDELKVLVDGLKTSSKYALDGYAGYEVVENPFLTPDSELVQGWLKGCKLFKATTLNSSVLLAFHGTYSNVVIRKICQQGFDPARRHCQGLGPGEYFGTSPQVAFDFSVSTNNLIATLVVSCPVARLRNLGKILVVNNPLDRKLTFCLPIFVIKYIKNPPSIPSSLVFEMETIEEEAEMQAATVMQLVESSSTANVVEA